MSYYEPVYCGTFSITEPIEELEDNTDDSTISGIVHKTLRKDNGDN